MKLSALPAKKRVMEADIERAYVKFIKGTGCNALKLVLLNQRGFPDRTVLFNGKVIFVEFKIKGGKLRPSQKAWELTLTKLGFKYFLCDEIGQAEKITIEEFNLELDT